MSAAHVMTSLEMMKIDDYPIVETADIDGDSTKHITQSNGSFTFRVGIIESQKGIFCVLQMVFSGARNTYRMR